MLWSPKQLQIECLQTTYHIDIQILLHLVFLPKTCEVYSRNIYIPVMVELMNNDPTLTSYRCFFLGFNLTHMNIILPMQSPYVTRLTPEQLTWLLHKLSNYRVVYYDSLWEPIQQIDKNYSYSIPILFTIFTTVLGTLTTLTCIAIFPYCKYICISNESKTSPYSATRGM